MTEFIDYYKVLGVSREATQEEIRRAFRKHARTYHPDVNKSEDAGVRFKEINEAYEVLKDPEKRKRYDAYGKNWQHAAENPSDGFWEQGYGQGSAAQSRSGTFRFSRDGSFGQTSGFSDFFYDLFGDRHDQGHHDRYGYASYDRPGRSQEADITVSLADVVNGATKSIALQTVHAGSRNRTGPDTRNFQVKIPKGVSEGSVIRLAGQGEAGVGSGPSGDLLIRIHIAPDPRFSIDGHDLHTVVDVAPWEAALGAKIPVQTPAGTLSLTVPKGSQSGRKLRLRGKGLPRSKGAGGDLIVEIQIKVPSTMTKEEQQLFEELKSVSSFNPRQKSGQRAAHRV